MGIFQNLKKSCLGDNNDSTADKIPPHKTTPSTNEDMLQTVRNDITDFQLLISLFRKYKINPETDFADFVRKVNPEATSHKCPYCSTVHEFTASRARKCPSCSKKMVVRQGLFLTEDQVKGLEKESQTFYERQDAIFRVGSSLESSQDHRIHKQQAEYLRALAEAFHYMAKVENQKDSKGYSFWDKAWSYYNAARVEEMKGLRKDMMQYSRLPDILWDMSQMLLDQSKYEIKEDQIKKLKRQALIKACITLAEAAKLDADPYFITELYTLAKNQITELSITDEDFKIITTDVALQMRIDGAALQKYKNWIQELSEFQIINRV
jgi:DNA-directed RNA polymerase subunit RPC12/RpoP